MPSNLLIFDADYVSELTGRMNTACELMAEAVNSLKAASNHDNWKCKERTRILDDFDNLNVKLGRLDTGVNETTRILGGSVVRFASLESQYESQANGLSDDLTSNHGYSATVHTDSGEDSGGGIGGVPSGGSSSQPGGNPEPSDPAGQAAGGAAGAAGAGAAGAGAAGAGGRPSGGHGGHGGHGGNGAAGAAAGRIAGEMGRGHQRPDAPHGEGHGAGSGYATGAGLGGGTMNVNLPVTHIPDTPDAAARGIKDTREIAQIAVTSVVSTMTEVLVGGNRASFSSSAEFSFSATAPTLAEAYNAGRTIFDCSNAIMSSPTMPHVDERIAMASGLVSLAEITSQGSLSSGIPITIAGGAGSAGSIDINAGSVHASADFSNNANYLLEVVPEDASEFRQVLGMLTGSASAGGSISASSVSGSSGGSFFDKIVEALKNAASGNTSSVASSGTSSLFSSSPVMEFLGNFIMG